MRVILCLLSAAALGGCATMQPVASVKPVCDAMVGPIIYDSADPGSSRYAGPALAPDLKQRNQVGQALHCPQYK